MLLRFSDCELMRPAVICIFICFSHAKSDACETNLEVTSAPAHHLVQVDRPDFHAWFRALDVDTNLTLETNTWSAVVRVPDRRWHALAVTCCGGDEEREATLEIPGLGYKTVIYTFGTTIKTSSDGRIMWSDCNMTLIDIPGAVPDMQDDLSDQGPKWVISLVVCLICIAVMAHFAWISVGFRHCHRKAVAEQQVYSHLQKMTDPETLS
ncbi:uncharacterized protein LOC122263802 [Penaeus japonicus]|uniref:uncharacterized protein LOC122263802 n=1 Tax=Penaeus japonicus TaxID=27405 RepID=UPI001C716733|nr:uncharacterized protein LOC122263802 [Penaeus japonicus]